MAVNSLDLEAGLQVLEQNLYLVHVGEALSPKSGCLESIPTGPVACKRV